MIFIGIKQCSLKLYDGLRLLVCFLALVASATAVATPNANILVLGDSLSAAYRFDVSLGWVNLLQQRLNAQGYNYGVINGSVSGNTTADGLARLPALLEVHKPQLLIVALGANDGLRGYPIKIMKQNLNRIITLGEAAAAKVMLVEIEIPPNYGKRYTQSFKAAFGEVAAMREVGLLPFFLYDVIDKVELMQADGIHPNAAAQTIILDTLWPKISSLISRGNLPI